MHYVLSLHFKKALLKDFVRLLSNKKKKRNERERNNLFWLQCFKVELLQRYCDCECAHKRVCACAKKCLLFVQYVLRMKASGSPLEKRAAAQSAVLLTITVCNKALIKQDSVYLKVVVF